MKYGRKKKNAIKKFCVLGISSAGRLETYMFKGFRSFFCLGIEIADFLENQILDIRCLCLNHFYCSKLSSLSLATTYSECKF